MIWLINYIFNNYDLNLLKIISPNPDWLSSWLDKNKDLLDIDINKITFSQKYPFFTKNTIHFRWGGEVLTDQRSFPYDGYLYPIKFFNKIFFEDFVLFWWIWKINKKRTKYLYNFLLPKAKNIVVREKDSFNIAKSYNKNTIQYHDFAIDVLDKFKIEKKSISNNILINWNPYIKSKYDRQKLFKACQIQNNEKIYFVPWDISEDISVYQILRSQYKNIEIYDRSDKSIKEIIDFFSTAKSGVGARLHFLLILKYLSIPYQSISYQDKISKLIDN